MRKLTWLLGGWMLATVLGAPALAETVYRWSADDGSVAFTDDAKRIPAQYRDQAQQTHTGDLKSYPRYTPMRTAPARAAGTADRIERARAADACEAAPAATASTPSTQTILQLNRRSSIAIPNEQLTGDGPIVVEQRRVRDRNNISTTHVTVVRQGDRILSVVRPESAHDRATWGSELDLLGER